MTCLETIKNAQRLSHVIDAIARVERSLEGVSREEFYANEDKQGNVVRCIEIIGEAANHISEEIRKANTDVPWSSIIGMRNNLIHGYNEVNYKFVWITAKYDLPELKIQAKRIFDSLELPSDFKFSTIKKEKRVTDD